MILKVPIQCNFAEISLNRMPENLEHKSMDLYFLKTFFGELIYAGGKMGKGYFRGDFYPGKILSIRVAESSSGVKVRGKS